MTCPVCNKPALGVRHYADGSVKYLHTIKVQIVKGERMKTFESTCFIPSMEKPTNPFITI